MRLPEVEQAEMAAGADPGPVESVTSFDAFISYASAQRHRALAIQHYLQAAGPAGSPRMTVYLDETDIRGGDLQTELGMALDRTRQLVVCCSPEAADSRWVGAEIRRFLAHHPAHDIVLAWLAGPLERAVPAELDVKALRVHDLRGWWFHRRPRPSTRIELARMYARLANLPMRAVVDWERRRTLAQLAVASGLSAMLVVTAGGVFVHQRETSEASVLLDRLAVKPSHDDAIRLIREAPMSIRRRAVSLVTTQPARAAVVVQSGWPVAVIGLDGELAAELLPVLRAALTTTDGEHIPVPRLENYRYALGMMQSQEQLQREAAAVLDDVKASEQAEGHPDSIYWLRARRSALMTGYVDLLYRLDDPKQQLGALRALSEEMFANEPDMVDALALAAAALRQRGVAFEPARSTEDIGGDADPPPNPEPPTPRVDPADALRRARGAVTSAVQPGQATAEYAHAAGIITDPGLLDAEIRAVETMRANVNPDSPQGLELLKMMAVLADRRGDPALVQRVGTLLAVALGKPEIPSTLMPVLRGAGFVNFPAPLQHLPSRLLETGEPAVLVKFVAAYTSLRKPGLAWNDLREALEHRKDVATTLLGATRVIKLVREELGYLNTPLYAPWAEEIRRNCMEWLGHVDDTAALRALLDDLARSIEADLASDRVGHLIAIYEVAAERLWVELKHPPDKEAVRQLVRLLPHPLWHKRVALLNLVTPTWAPDIGDGIAPFVAWAQTTHDIQLKLTAPAAASAAGPR